LGKYILIFISLIFTGCQPQEPKIVLPNYVFTYLPEYGYLKAQGTWEAINFEMAYPINLVQLECDSKTKSCRVFSVDFSRVSNGHTAVPFLDIFEVTDWNNLQIKAESNHGERKSVLSIDLKNKIITLDSYPIRQSASQDIRHMVLVDGFKKSLK